MYNTLITMPVNTGLRRILSNW